MHSLLRFPYAALGAAAELGAALTPDGTTKWRRALAARRGLMARYAAFAPQRDPSQPLAWFHAPSVGEALQALPVMQRLRSNGFVGQTAFTWFSPSAEPFAPRFESEFMEYLPFDTSRGARGALDALQPTALVYSKLDVWPLLTAHAAHRGVRLGMISATLAPGSSRRGRLARSLLADAYAQLDLVGAISAGDAERLVDLGVRRDAIRVTGDTRFDQVWDRVTRQDGAPALVARLASDRPTLVAGSTWPADEGPLEAAWELVRQKLPAARLVIAPHEPNPAHLAPIRAWATRAGLTLASQAAPEARDADVVLVDRVGVLADLYALGRAAFVGGGFHDAGLHSVLEPAAVGVPVLFGPRWQASPDAGALLAAGGAAAVNDAHDLAKALDTWLRDPIDKNVAGPAAAAFVQAGRGAAARSAALVDELIQGRNIRPQGRVKGRSS